jgi:hypothetical protein
MVKYSGKQEEELREARGCESAVNNVDYIGKSGSRINRWR